MFATIFLFLFNVMLVVSWIVVILPAFKDSSMLPWAIFLTGGLFVTIENIIITQISFYKNSFLNKRNKKQQ